jgi:hypothetical protein
MCTQRPESQAPPLLLMLSTNQPHTPMSTLARNSTCPTMHDVAAAPTRTSSPRPPLDPFDQELQELLVDESPAEGT